jgi:hypothetical protein
MILSLWSFVWVVIFVRGVYVLYGSLRNLLGDWNLLGLFLGDMYDI